MRVSTSLCSPQSYVTEKYEPDTWCSRAWLGTFPVFPLMSRVPGTCIITTNGLGWWCKLFPFLLQTERSGRLAEMLLTLASGASEQHLAMSTVLLSGQFVPCRVHGAGVALLSCPAGPSGRCIPGRAEPRCREVPIRGLCTQSGALAAPRPASLQDSPLRWH